MLIYNIDHYIQLNIHGYILNIIMYVFIFIYICIFFYMKNVIGLMIQNAEY